MEVKPINMLLQCPMCGMPHVDAPEPTRGWTNPPHKSHLCHGCGCIWRPADVPTNGVAFLSTVGASDTCANSWSARAASIVRARQRDDSIVVPREPSFDMLRRAETDGECVYDCDCGASGQLDRETARAVWKAMVDAAPPEQWKAAFPKPRTTTSESAVSRDA